MGPRPSCRRLFPVYNCSSMGALPRRISRLAAAAAVIFCALSAAPRGLAAEPSAISSLQIWLKAGSAVPDDNGQLSAWPDSSGRGKNFIQSNGKYQPLLREDRLNGLPSVQFGKKQFLDSPAGALPDSDKITAFIVLRAGRDGGRTVLSSSYASGAKKDSDDMWGVFLSGKKIYSYARDAKGKAGTVQLPSDKDRWVVHSTIWDSKTSFNAWLDGIAGKAEKGLDAKPAGHRRTRIGNLADCGARNPDCGMMEKSGNGVSNGAGQALPASSGGYAGRAEHETLKNCGGGSQDAVEIAELIVYGKALSNSERLAVESYLHDKYFSDRTPPAISAVLAADEPLKAVVSFSEEIDPDSVNPANFAITSRAVIPGRQNGGACLSRPQMSEVPDNEMSGKNAQPTLSAVIRPDGRSVELALATPLAADNTYTLSVSGVKDIAGNRIKDSSKADFDWTDIPSDGMALWLRADRNVATAQDKSVTLWNDSSANSRNAIPIVKNKKNEVSQSPDEGLVASRGDGAARPQDKTPPAHGGEASSLPILIENSVNSLPSIRLQGCKSGFTCGAIPELGTDKISWFAVFRTDDTGKYQFIIENAYLDGARSHSDSLWGIFINDGQINTHSRNAKGFFKNVKHPADPAWHIVSGVWSDRDEVIARLDGVNEARVPGADAVPETHLNLAVGTWNLKGTRPLDGGLAEIIVYSREITAQERDQVENYLRGKYLETEKQWSVSFSPGTGGTLEGETNQTVPDGGDCTVVTAIPDAGRYFVKWSLPDGGTYSTSNPLTVTNVTSDMVLSADFITSTADSDNDLLPDWWEFAHFKNTDQTAGADPDNDGISNLLEYRLGLDPSITAEKDTGSTLGFKLYSPTW